MADAREFLKWLRKSFGPEKLEAMGDAPNQVIDPERAKLTEAERYRVIADAWREMMAQPDENFESDVVNFLGLCAEVIGAGDAVEMLKRAGFN